MEWYVNGFERSGRHSPESKLEEKMKLKYICSVATFETLEWSWQMKTFRK